MSLDMAVDNMKKFKDASSSPYAPAAPASFFKSKVNEEKGEVTYTKTENIGRYGAPGYLCHVEVIKDIRKLKAGKFTWTNIPMLAVITGKNGVNKTTFLRILTQHFDEIYKNLDEKSMLDFLPDRQVAQPATEERPQQSTFLETKKTVVATPHLLAYSSTFEFHNVLKNNYKKKFINLIIW